jgi:hypothetical protein
VTVCVEGRKRILGSVRGGIMRLSDAGRAVQEAWERLPSHYPHVRLDAFVIMPDHVHGIVMLGWGDEWRVGHHPRVARRSVATPAPCIAGNRPRVQILLRARHKRSPRHAGRPCLATELLRTDYP